MWRLAVLFFSQECVAVGFCVYMRVSSLQRRPVDATNPGREDGCWEAEEAEGKVECEDDEGGAEDAEHPFQARHWQIHMGASPQNHSFSYGSPL